MIRHPTMFLIGLAFVVPGLLFGVLGVFAAHDALVVLALWMLAAGVSCMFLYVNGERVGIDRDDE